MNQESFSSGSVLQVQPQSADFSKWVSLAHEEDLKFEVLEMVMAPALNESGRFQLLKKEYSSCGLVNSLHGAFIDINPASGDTEFRAISRKRCRESCELAKDIGAKHVVFHSSCLPFVRGQYLDYWAGTCAEFYEELADTYDLKIMIENSQDIDPDPIRNLMKRISDRRIGVCLDLGHANYSQVPVSEWLDSLGSRIRYMHLSDNTGHFDDHLPIGKGTIDWSKVHRFWKRTGGKMPMTFEVGSLYGVRESLSYIRNHGFFGK